MARGLRIEKNGVVDGAFPNVAVKIKRKGGFHIFRMENPGELSQSTKGMSSTENHTFDIQLKSPSSPAHLIWINSPLNAH